jgi:adenylate cyclase
MHANVFLRTLRLVTGLVLMAFVTGHLANLSIGLHSLAAMEDWLGTLMAPWQTSLGRVLLAGSALVHAALGLYAMAMRRSLAMRKTDWVQLVLGVLTPPLLLNHVLMTAIAPRLAADYEPSYGQLLSVYWSIAPAYAFQQLFVVLFVWVHAALGLYSWLVLKPAWRRIGGFVLPVLFAVPIVALMGFAEAGKEVIEKLAHDAAWRDLILQNQARLDEARAQLSVLNTMLVRVYGGFVLLALAVFAGRILRDRLTRVRVAYDAGFSATGRRGLSILELSRLNGVPHADVCSGRGRCGTCRVHVTAGSSALSRRNAIEDKTLERVHADGGDRLACQARVLGEGVEVVRALPAYADASAARQPGDWAEDTASPVTPATGASA